MRVQRLSIAIVFIKAHGIDLGPLEKNLPRLFFIPEQKLILRSLIIFMADLVRLNKHFF